MLNRIFVYGTLKRNFCNHDIVKPFLKSATSAELKGLIYDLPVGYPAAIDGDGQVIGEIFELTDIELALAVLDRLEDYYGPNCRKNLYDRVIRDVSLINGEKVSAYVYLWASPPELEKVGKCLVDGIWK
ncbi:gamma-glutamylcyclotransferase family protein [Sporomusa malonica]|uniref:Uncharacterized conserved protein YtfP, gamma-glutamylcyclotransferase (GGCT)/AIG2-like family n=1 Tax=Sporomusa malonica TaxID=112901 RepID=A0A1W2EHC1_9FIRM|nr:gamma-glutamylcyclotransferase family protein [Sporomusa malonica]SMD08842.1 Uncharacterized conserved protein YtfP, gamma-glutamylcyclotransferase (GGCT)/AIG2-like family [Sporomusa malonica]